MISAILPEQVFFAFQAMLCKIILIDDSFIVKSVIKAKYIPIIPIQITSIALMAMCEIDEIVTN